MLKVGAAYIRVSTDDQLEYSPESQLKAIREYAKREGYIVPDDYVFPEDNGISGKSAAKRPKFKLMIAHAKNDPAPFSAIFVWKFSRFARNQEEAILYKNLLKKHGVDVISITEPSSDSPFASLIERIIEWMDEYYLTNLAGEVRRGMAEKAARGEPTGVAPFGYKVQDKKLVIVEDEAAVIRWIFDQYVGGVGARMIAQQLNERGIKTRRGNSPDYRFVHYILTNPKYIGNVRYSTEGHANYDREYYDGKNVVVYENTHEPIIDMDTWDRAQEIVKAKRPEVAYKREKSTPYMLRGLVRCSSCGATLTRLSTKAVSMQCNKYSRGQCIESHCVTMRKLESDIISALETCVKNKEFKFSAPKPQKSKITQDWDKLIAMEGARLARARNAYLSGLFEADEYRVVKEEVEDNLRKLREMQAFEKETEAKTPAPQDTYADKVVTVLEIIRDPSVDADSKNAALRSIIDKIVMSKHPYSLDFYFVP